MPWSKPLIRQARAGTGGRGDLHGTHADQGGGDRMILRVLDLFSGIGGFSLGLERAGMKTVAFCEIEDYPRRVLAKHWPGVPIYEDVRNVTRERLETDGIGRIDVITGGFPCQDLSVAGKQAGIEGERSGLWGELCRIIGDVRPRYAIVENVTALISGDSGRWFGRVLGDLAEIGFDAEWHCIPASELGAHHHRDRVWIVAYPSELQRNGSYIHNEHIERQKNGVKPGGSGRQVNSSSANNQGLQGREKYGIFGKGGENWHELIAGCFCGFGDVSQVKPTICRDSDGISNHAHRLKGLGNAICPQISELIGRAIIKAGATG